MDKQIKITTESKRIRKELSEVDRLFSDNSLAKKMLSWTPNYKGKEGLKKGLEKTIDWFSNPDNMDKYKSDIYNI